jgi:hypothetical protein
MPAGRAKKVIVVRNLGSHFLTVLLGVSCLLLACGDPEGVAKRPDRDAAPEGDGGAADASGSDSGVDSGPELVTCADADCDANATCDDSNGAAVCTCAAGYAGDGESCTDLDECAASGDSPCGAHAECNNTVGGYECVCASGYSGDGQTCTDIDECATLEFQCKPAATCVDSEGSAGWECIDGYSGTAGACTDIDECAGASPPTCGVNQACVNTRGLATGATCGCATGYHESTPGDATVDCVVNTACPNGNECGANATCQTVASVQLCVCAAGYVGDGTTCADLDECTTGRHDCDPAATCANTTGSFTCTCAPGFIGDGHTCTYEEECATDDDCESSAKCVDTLCGKACRCPEGYESDGAGGCRNIDECARSSLNDCHENGVCTDEDPGYSCACKDGFTGDGRIYCENVDECASSELNDCGETETCTDVAGSYTCGCDDPYVKDGDACYCDLDGFWAMRQDVTVTWAPVTLPGGATLINGGTLNTTVWELHRFRYDGTTLQVDKKGCGSAKTPDLISPAITGYDETWGTYVPDFVWDAFGLLDGADVPLTEATPGTAFVTPTEAAVLGLDMDDPINGDWPLSRDDIALNKRTDPDGDGIPGLMIWSRRPNEMTQASTGAKSKFYDYLPVGYPGPAAACITNASRSKGHFEGTVETCSRITGTVINEGADGRAYDCRIAPANQANCTAQTCCTKQNWDSLTPCTPTQIDVLDGQAADQTSTATFELVKVSGNPDATNITCETVRTMLPAL